MQLTSLGGYWGNCNSWKTHTGTSRRRRWRQSKCARSWHTASCWAGPAPVKFVVPLFWPSPEKWRLKEGPSLCGFVYCRQLLTSLLQSCLKPWDSWSEARSCLTNILLCSTFRIKSYCVVGPIDDLIKRRKFINETLALVIITYYSLTALTIWYRQGFMPDLHILYSESWQF